MVIILFLNNYFAIYCLINLYSLYFYKNERLKLMKKIILVLIACISLLICTFTFFWIDKNYYTIEYTSNEFKETAQFLNNPYCGWYQICAYMITDDAYNHFDDLTNRYIRTCNNTRLALIEINLKNFNDKDLSDNALKQIDRILTMWNNGKHLLILRFMYDWDGKAMETEPSDISIIKKHMEQTAQIVNLHTDNVYILQGIFVGNHAEMNNSNYMSTNSMTTLANHLDSLISKDIFLSVRTPQQLRTILQTASIPENNRIGLYNDGMLGSTLDLGTYGAASDTFTEENYASKGNRTQELDYQNKLCKNVPNGGEVVLENPLNDINNAIAALSTMHVSYLNCLHDTTVIDKWKTQIYEGNDMFNGVTGYDYMTAHLGYRYTFVDSSINYTPFNDIFTIKLDIKNVGFSSSYHDFNGMLNLVKTNSDNTMDTQKTINTESISFSKDITTALHTSDWQPNSVVTIDTSLPVQSIEEGIYDIYIKIYNQNNTDHNNHSEKNEVIQFANDIPLTENGYKIGTIHIKQGV